MFFNWGVFINRHSGLHLPHENDPLKWGVFYGFLTFYLNLAPISCGSQLLKSSYSWRPLGPCSASCSDSLYIMCLDDALRLKWGELISKDWFCFRLVLVTAMRYSSSPQVCSLGGSISRVRWTGFHERKPTPKSIIYEVYSEVNKVPLHHI